MRTIKLLFLIAFAFTCAVQAQTQSPQTKSEQTKSPKIKSNIRMTTYALKGPVKSVRTEAATFVLKDGQWVEGPRLLEMTVDFAEDGNRTQVAFYREGKLTRRIEDKYDEDGRQIEFLNYDGAGNMWLRGTFAYGEDGKTKEEVTYNGDGSVRSKRSIKRNEQGQILETVELNPNGIVMEKLTNTFVDGALATTFRSLHYADGRVARTEAYEIPKKRVETISYKPDGSVQNKTIRVDREISEYAKDGTLIKTTTISTEGRLLDEVSVGPGGPSKREAQLPDQFDSHENWIVQTKWHADAKGSRPLKISYRTITYYQTFTF
jgi:antitoxin component YwqK of YwqJK toxin-antitoxin module